MRYTTSAHGLAIESGALIVSVEMLGLCMYLVALIWTVPYYNAGAWMNKVVLDGCIMYSVCGCWGSWYWPVVMYVRMG